MAATVQGDKGQLASADSAAQARQREMVVFGLGHEEYAIDIHKVQEIRSYSPKSITFIPNAPPFVVGVTNLRGNIVPIVDLRLRLSMQNATVDNQTVVIILNLEKKVVGIIVDGVSDVLMLDAGQINPAPGIACTIDTRYIRGLATVGERMLILLDIEALMTGVDMGLADDNAA